MDSIDQTRNRFFAVAGLSVILYGAAAHFATYAYLIPGQRQGSDELVYWIADILTIAGVYFAYKVLASNLIPDLQWRPANLYWYAGSAAMGGLFYFLSDFIIQTYGGFGIHGTSVLTEFRHLSPSLSYLVLLEIGIVSPIVQEIVFRGWLLAGLMRVLPSTPAILISAAVFSAMHIRSGIPALTHAFLFGILAGILFLRSRSIVPSTILHIVVNSTSALVWLTGLANR